MIITWNMQGGKASTENKWNVGVLNFFSTYGDELSACCLQECGGVPGSANQTGVFIYGPGGPGYQLSTYEWAGTRSGRVPYLQITFCRWDTGGNRCNLAVVSRQTPQGRVLTYPPTPNAWRPAVGVNLGGEWLFTIHAISPRGPDAGDLIQAAALAAGANPWMVAGDFNCPPGGLPLLPPGLSVCRANKATYKVGNPVSMYDYAVASAGPGAVGTVLTEEIYSDHYPVAYR